RAKQDAPPLRARHPPANHEAALLADLGLEPCPRRTTGEVGGRGVFGDVALQFARQDFPPARVPVPGEPAHGENRARTVQEMVEDVSACRQRAGTEIPVLRVEYI